MTNPILLLVFAIVLTFLSGMFPLQSHSGEDASVRERMREISGGATLAGILLLLFFAATKIWPGTFKDGNILAMSAAIGILISCFAASSDRRFSAFPLGLATVGAALVHLTGSSTGEGHLAYIVGTLVGAFATSGARPKMHGGYLAVFCAALISSADFLGHRADGSEAASVTGIALAIVGLIGAIASGAMRTQTSQTLRSLVSLLLLALVGSLASWKFLGSLELAAIWASAVVIGGIVHLIFEGETEPTPLRFVLSSIIWIATATVAFGLKLGYGMAVALIGGASSLIILGSIRGLMSMAIALSILIYRFFRELQPEGARALDIGQHYSLVGITLGALLPLLPIEWSRSTRTKSSLAGVLWLLLLIGIPVAVSLLLGGKGAVGLVVGFAFASLIEGARGSVTLEAIGIAAGLGALTTLSYGWLVPLMDLGRDEKTKGLVGVAVAVVIIGSLLNWVGKKDAAVKA